MNVLLRSSAYARRSSCSVFITIGPYQATAWMGSRRRAGSESLLARLHDHFIAAIEQHQRSVSRRARHGLVIDAVRPDHLVWTAGL
jgi:hypothetical protein